MAGPDPLLRHIRHAEEWLGRARRDWRRGNAPAAMLRLMLAEAEIRHARETGGRAASPPEGGQVDRSRRAGWPRAAAVIAAAAILAAGLGYASLGLGLARHEALAARDGSAAAISGPGGPAGAGISRTIVRLDSGEFLMPDAGRPGDSGFAGRDGRPTQFAVPVDLKTPSPTF
ncbi:MAG TPA: hypothetical protein VGX75_04190 [bacterium]|nr:hypothetical protein [bacterium]